MCVSFDQFAFSLTFSAQKLGKTLASSILVPFPVESCLSGVAPNSSDNIVMKMWYRITFDAPALETMDGSHLQLNFGAIDWNSTVYLNRKMLGNHVGGYDGFSFTIDPSALNPSGNELIVYVYDPSDTGSQPNGKQRISAISQPGGDTYTPSSGIWQTVWIESVPDVCVLNSLSSILPCSLSRPTTYPRPLSLFVDFLVVLGLQNESSGLR